MDTKQIIDLFERYVVPNYSRNNVVIVKGEGSYVWDSEGRRYLDLFPGWGCNGLGHCHPRVVKALKRQAARLIHVANNYYNELQGELAMRISTRSFGGKCFFCNSGAEAVEGAIKFARIFAGPKRYKILTMENSFHGRTLAAITATGQEKYHRGIGPLSPGFETVPFNDIDAVAAAADDETCAVMLELIQGEGGVNIADEAYVARLRELCDGTNVLFIVDEVQTGCGRTGEYFADCQQAVDTLMAYGVPPIGQPGKRQKFTFEYAGVQWEGVAKDYEPFAKEIIIVHGPGAASPHLKSLEYKLVTRPIFPLDENTTFEI